MTKIKFRFEWFNEQKTGLHLIAEADWNWRDYHAGARAAAFNTISLNHPVTMLLDFSQHSRATMPAGVAAHAQTFGKAITPNLDGNAIVIGLTNDDLAKIPREENGTLPTKDGTVYFVDDVDTAREVLAQLHSDR